MAKIFSALFVGLIFGSGIAISGMINPTKVRNFFDFAGTWDPSLALVMGGALGVTIIGYRIVLKRNMPLLDQQFHLPRKSGLDMQLIVGSALLGVAWGISGFCPGGSIPALGLLQVSALYFVLSMIVGIIVARFFLRNVAFRQGGNAPARN